MSDVNGMRCVGVMYADLARSSLGTRSRLADEVAGAAVLRRTVERLAGAERLAEIMVFCPEGQREQVGGLLAGTQAAVVGLQQAAPLSSHVVRRKWALDSWRGGLGEATQFDEYAVTGEMVQRLHERGATTAMLVGADAVLIDPGLVDAMLDYHYDKCEDMRFTFSQAPPGLAGSVYRLDLFAEMAHSGAHIGDAIAYSPTSPHADFINAECTYKVDERIWGSRFRYLADTQRSVERLSELLAGDGVSGWRAEQITAAMAGCEEQAGRLPKELVVEINTERSLRVAGYPQGRGDLGRGPMSLEQFVKIVKDCGEYDDVRVTLGGAGEPLAHGEVGAMVRAAKEAGILGVNIETDGRGLKGELADELLEAGVDVVSVFLDANSPELYQALKGEDCFAEVARGVEQFADKAKQLGGRTMVAPHLIKMRETMAEMEEFYDRWITRCGAAVMVGYNDFAGQVADKAVMDMAPPMRWACGRLFERMMILADGGVTMCEQDFGGKCKLGNVFEQSVGEIWRGKELEELREAHRAARFTENELCVKCKEWHR